MELGIMGGRDYHEAIHELYRAHQSIMKLMGICHYDSGGIITDDLQAIHQRMQLLDRVLKAHVDRADLPALSNCNGYNANLHLPDGRGDLFLS